MAAAAAARPEGGDGPPAEVVARVWIAPFAYGGAAGQQALTALAAEGYRDHRWAAPAWGGEGFGLGIRVHISIILVSFCPVLMYYLLLAFQRSVWSEERTAQTAAAATASSDEAPATQEQAELSAPIRGWWAVHWHALFGDDSVQVAISSWSAAASGNAFHSPGTARKNMVVGRRKSSRGDRRDGPGPEEAEEAHEIELEAEEPDQSDGWDGCWARVSRFSDVWWQEWYGEKKGSSTSHDEPDEPEERVGDLPPDGPRRRGKPAPTPGPGDGMLGTTTATATTTTTTTPGSEMTEPGATTAVCKTAGGGAQAGRNHASGGCDREVGRQGSSSTTPSGGGCATAGGTPPPHGERRNTARRRRRDCGGAGAVGDNNAGAAEGNSGRLRGEVDGDASEAGTAAALTKARSPRRTTASGGNGGGHGGGEGRKEDIGGHPRPGRGGRKQFGAAAAGGGRSRDVGAVGGGVQGFATGGSDDRGPTGGVGAGGRRESSEEAGGSGSSSSQKKDEESGGWEEELEAEEAETAVEKGTKGAAVYRLPYGV
eukprot:g3367.t1